MDNNGFHLFEPSSKKNLYNPKNLNLNEKFVNKLKKRIDNYNNFDISVTKYLSK